MNKSILERKRFLVVDDIELERDLNSTILKEANAYVDMASNGQEAIEKIKMCKYDCILMDIYMPEIDGIDTTIIIRSCGIFTPIIAVTAASSEDEKNRAFRAGINAYIFKPLNIEKLVAIIEEIWRKKDECAICCCTS